jgi:small subunit ribosomal protein S11
MANTKQTKEVKKKSNVTVSEHGRAYISASFNNTIVTLTNDNGDTLSWSSSGAKGFKGARKSTPYAGSMAMEDAAAKATHMGLKSVDAFVKGPGPGRDSALRAIKTGGLSIASITDITPMPHNGPRAKNRRRV